MPKPEISVPAILCGRENSVTFMRLFLASMVVFGHAFVLAGYGEEPLSRLAAGAPSGRELAVLGFFGLSGFLVSKSLASNPSLWRFACHRLFRIVPAFWVCLLVTVFIMAPAVIEGSFPGRLTYWEKLSGGSASPLRYLAGNWSLVMSDYLIIPLFAANPERFSPNGSLWSIMVESALYLHLALAAAVLRIPVRRALALAPVAALGAWWFSSMGLLVFAVMCLWRCVRASGFVALFTLVWCSAVGTHFLPGWSGALRPLVPVLVHIIESPIWTNASLAFLGGIACWRWRDSIPWNWRWFAALAALMAASVPVKCWALVAPFAVPYCTLMLAARLPFSRVEKMGDYSYGIYIFSFPIQQLLIWGGWNNAGPYGFAALSMLAIFPIAFLSWHLLEKPMLTLGKRVARWSPRRPEPEPLAALQPTPM